VDARNSSDAALSIAHGEMTATPGSRQARLELQIAPSLGEASVSLKVLG
jgi:hypothetical protein